MKLTREAVLKCYNRAQADFITVDDVIPATDMAVKSVRYDHQFNRDRLAAERNTVLRLLEQLPLSVMDARIKGGEGGSSPLEMHLNRVGNRWSDPVYINDLDRLVALGLGLDMVKFLVSPGVWVSC